jgi:hypothetical protein
VWLSPLSVRSSVQVPKRAFFFARSFLYGCAHSVVCARSCLSLSSTEHTAARLHTLAMGCEVAATLRVALVRAWGEGGVELLFIAIRDASQWTQKLCTCRTRPLPLSPGWFFSPVLGSLVSCADVHR